MLPISIKLFRVDACRAFLYDTNEAVEFIFKKIINLNFLNFKIIKSLNGC